MGGTLALVGGGEFRPGAKGLDADLLEASGTNRVIVVPTAAAYERPEHTIEEASRHFADLGAEVVALMALTRRDCDSKHTDVLDGARFVYLTDGSPLHLRSALKDSVLLAELVAVYERGGVLAASGAGATLLCDPMIDPRGGAYTVGLGLVENVAIFPYHGTAAEHMWERSKDLLPKGATLVGVDEQTAIVRRGDGPWVVDGPGRVTVHRRDSADTVVARPAEIPGL